MTKNIGIATIFIWIGFVAAISFMEAWLKFRAPGVTLPIGLGIGRLVFNALNKIEWVFLISCLLSIYPLKSKNLTLKAILLIPILIVIIQTIWLLPFLDARAEQHILGASVPPSNIHFYYVIAEAIKLCALFISGIMLFKSNKH